MTTRKVRIVSTGKYLPSRIVPSEELDEIMRLPRGTVHEKTGVAQRYYAADNEYASCMAKVAIERALEKGNLSLEDIDALVCTSGTAQQIIPSCASLIMKSLNANRKTKVNIPAFDINATCLSFVTGLDTISYLVDAGRFKRVIVVSADKASVGLNYEDMESSTLFGDGACAIIIERTPENNNAQILGSFMRTYSEGSSYCQIKGGASGMHARQYNKDTYADYCFKMDGRAVFKLSSKVFPDFMKDFMDETKIKMNDIDMFIPHQASGPGLELIRKRLGVEKERVVNILETHGNMVSVSIPLALHEAIEQNRLKRGQKAMLLGTSAGLSLGGLAFIY